MFARVYERFFVVVVVVVLSHNGIVCKSNRRSVFVSFLHCGEI